MGAAFCCGVVFSPKHERLTLCTSLAFAGCFGFGTSYAKANH